MHNTLNIIVERYPIAGKFTISRGSKTEAVVVVCVIGNGLNQGRGECVPYARYGESIESVSAQIEAARTAIESGATRQDIQTLMPAGAARNAVDCALWDLEAKASGRSVADMLGTPTRPLETAITVSLGTPAEMAESAAKVAHYPLIKVKMGGENDIEKIQAVTSAARTVASLSMQTKVGRPTILPRTCAQQPTQASFLSNSPYQRITIIFSVKLNGLSLSVPMKAFIRRSDLRSWPSATTR